jgi:glutathione-regulated potassium-efflux system ancillary protein KefG
MKPEDCEKNGLDYGLFLDYLEKNKLQTTEISSYEYMNDWFFTKQN